MALFSYRFKCLSAVFQVCSTEADKSHKLSLPLCRFHVVALKIKGGEGRGLRCGTLTENIARL